MSVFGFYVHHRANGIPFYVGKGTQLRSRLFSRRNQFHKNIVRKDGIENIATTFTPCESEEEAFRKEIALIALYRAIGLELVNATDGGEGPSNPLPEVRAKIGAKLKERWQNPETREALLRVIHDPERIERARQRGYARKGIRLSAEHRAKIGAASKGNKHSLGHKHSAETRARMSASKKALCQDPAVRKRMSDSRKGAKHSEETKRKIGEAHKSLWQDADYRSQHQTTDETKAKIGAKTKELWTSSDYRLKVLGGVTGKKRSPEVRAKIGAAIKAALAKPETLARKRAAANTPEMKAEYARRAQAFWSSPEGQRRKAAKRKRLAGDGN